MSFYYVEAEMEKIRMTVGSQTKSTSTMDNHNYPGLYQCADITANSRQKTYFLLQKIYLGSLVIGGLLGIFVSFFVTVFPTHIATDWQLRYASIAGGKCRHGSLKI
jgi:hypothetical protein